MVRSRTAPEVEQKYKLSDIETNDEVITQLQKDIVPDSQLSSTSTKSLENRVITARFGLVNTQLSGKVDKEEGKGLSTNDFTDALKTKLDNLTPTGGESIPIGSIIPFGSSTAPNRWLLCDGRELSRTEYTDLFDVIGVTYGSGDGSTTFNLPNLKGKVPVGQDTTDTNFNLLGKTGGEATHTLTTSEMPSHTHKGWLSGGSTTGVTQATHGGYNSGRSTQDLTLTGGGQAHNNLQPYIVLNYIIKSI